MGAQDYRFTLAEQAYLERMGQIQEVSAALRHTSREAFRRLVDGFDEYPLDDQERSEARRYANELVDQLGRQEELARAYQVVGVATWHAGECPVRFQPVEREADYERINDADFDRAVRLRERAEVHALSAVVSDHLSQEHRDLLAVPGI
jgi:hypothetical protein